MLDAAQASPDLHFSLSHTRGLAACAVGRPYALGIDAEAWRTPAPIELASRYFAPTEVRLLIARAPAERPSTFYRLWTLKEAYLKATGQGLAAPLDSFAFSLDPVAIAIGPPECRGRLALRRVPTRARAFARLGGAVSAPIPVDAVAVSPHACLGNPDMRPDRRGRPLPKGTDLRFIVPNWPNRRVLVANPFESDDIDYRVLVNAEGQHSIWPTFREIPAGWSAHRPNRTSAELSRLD